MTQYSITAPSHLQHTAKLPASKSISNRALIIHALSGGSILPDNLSNCDDTEVIVTALKDNPYEINIKAAGTAMRFMTAYLAVRDGEEHILTGTERMKHRPIGILVDALRFLGADIVKAAVYIRLCFQLLRRFGMPVIRINWAHLFSPPPDHVANLHLYWFQTLH